MGHSPAQPGKRSEPLENGIFHENQIIQIVFENVFCIIMMNATAPEWTSPRRFLGLQIQKTILPCRASERP
jgi:hypothetical protein